METRQQSNVSQIRDTELYIARIDTNAWVDEIGKEENRRETNHSTPWPT